jgi:hypothetical protein
MNGRENQTGGARTARGTVSSGGHLNVMTLDCEMLVRNPAPDVSPPAAPTGKVCTISISAGARL